MIIHIADVFALDSSELGKTGITTHSINTGDHYPIRRRTPFARWMKWYKRYGARSGSTFQEPMDKFLVRKKDGGVCGLLEARLAG